MSQIVPGSRKAVLRLSDGREVTLEKETTCVLTEEDGTRISVGGQEHIVYQAVSQEQEKLAYNTITVPRGGEYSLVLSDGTRVWLNAETELTYPTVFGKGERKLMLMMMMAVTKTDEKDACMIAMYGEKMNPPIYKMPSQAIILLKQKKTVIRQLRKQLVASKNLRGSLVVLPYRDKACVRALDKTIDFLTRQIEQLEAELADIASSEFDKQLKALTSIKGIGITLATALILTTGGFTYFDNAKQLSRFIGICPTYQQSGTSVNIKGHINRNGDEHLRSLLYVASWTALRYNAACRECYLRLKANGKPSKVALIAVANKLVRQAFAIATTDSTYVDGFVSTKK